MHCVIVGGGKAPNVVPDRAVIWYYIRGRDRKQVDALRERVVKCAQGAALATETTWKMDVLTCCTERLVNRTMGGLMESVLAKCGMPKFTPADIRQCQRLSPGRKIAFFQKPLPTRSTQRFGSSDEDNASWFAPMGKVWLTCMPKETVGHHRDEAALAVSEAAHKGMAKAAEMMSLAMVELFANRPLLKRAQAEYRQARKGKQYNLPLSKNAIELSQALSERSEGRRP
jgi:aminobenzoyl-glutamate utilization protein B